MSTGAIIGGIEDAIVGAEKAPVCFPSLNPVGGSSVLEMMRKAKQINAYLAFTGKWPPPEFMEALDQKYGK